MKCYELIGTQQKLTVAAGVATNYAAEEGTQTVDNIQLVANLSYWGPRNPAEPLAWENINCPDPNPLRVGVSDLTVKAGQPVQVVVTIDLQPDDVTPAAWDGIFPTELSASVDMRKGGLE